MSGMISTLAGKDRLITAIRIRLANKKQKPKPNTMPVYNALLSSLVTNTIPETASTEETAVRGESLYVGSASISFVEPHFDV